MNENDSRYRAPTASMPAEYGAECTKEVRRDVSYIEHAPDNQVVLSPRLEQLVRRVGGCQTEQVLAVVRRIMYEVLQQGKY